jgi:isoquinoline 1-oxidoreductase beta subunit
MKSQEADAAVVISRRQVLSVFPQAGVAFVLGFCLDGCGMGERRGHGWVEPVPPDTWLKIDAQGNVDVVVARSEMGQGVRTALPMVVAEELEADWSRIRVVPALADRQRYGDQTTGGSLSIRTSWKRLRRVGATARTMLVAAAAEKWSVAEQECNAEAGYVIHNGSRQRLGYGDLAEAASQREVPRSVKVKEPAEFRLLGKPLKRLDTPGKVRGEAKFGIDVRVPNMAFAALARCPRIGGRLASFDAAKAKQTPGAIDVLEVDGSVVVLGESTWAALSARDALHVEWEAGGGEEVSSESLWRYFEEELEQPARVLHEWGSLEVGLEASSRRLEAVYRCPFLAHTPMEPMNCTADVRPDSCEIWTPTQVPNEVREMAAERTGLPIERVTVHTTLLGGGFGRRLVMDYAVEAVEVSRRAGRPVQVVWSREDDIQHGHFRPASYHRLTAGLDAGGSLLAFGHTMVAPSILDQLGRLEDDLDGEVRSELTHLYGPPHLCVDYVKANTQVPVSWMRSVYNMDAAFAEECFLDEVATASKRDPVALRSELLQAAEAIVVSPDPWSPARLRRVMEVAVERADWGGTTENRYKGIACHGSYLSYAAAVVEVSATGEKLRIERIVVAVDCGQVINPGILEAQVEGGVIFALSAALEGEITFANGLVEQSNFHDYKMVRMANAPLIETHIVESTSAPTGAGELPVPVVAPALANAVFAAAGKRLRDLPLKGVTFEAA